MLFPEHAARKEMKKEMDGEKETESAAADGEAGRNTFRFPARSRGTVLAALRGTGEESTRICKGRVLVMDDQEIVRSILCVMLFALGYETRPVSDGAEAIASYTAAKESGNSFDAVIIDLNIHGGMGGREAIKRLLEVDEGVRAVVSSGDWQDPAMENFAQYGFSGTLRKPYSIGELRRVMNDAICRDRVGLCGMLSDVAGTGG